MRVQMERKIEEMREEHKWELKQLAYDYENRYENNSKTKLL